MIGSEDAVLALSNSGETTEFADIVAYSRRCNIPLIAITGGARSTLAAAADVVLLLPAAAEACPMGLAPTTSTTMMAALVDALALALLERKGFSSADFRLYHPGGRLGRRQETWNSRRRIPGQLQLRRLADRSSGDSRSRCRRRCASRESRPGTAGRRESTRCVTGPRWPAAAGTLCRFVRRHSASVRCRSALSTD